jgi:hypothetical protein
MRDSSEELVNSLRVSNYLNFETASVSHKSWRNRRASGPQLGPELGPHLGLQLVRELGPELAAELHSHPHPYSPTPSPS